MATVAPILAVTGNEGVAEAMRQVNPDVVAAYPITPATEIAQIFAQYVADGKVDTEFITVESEHSAMSAAIGASASGARTMTATSSQGLALMWEMLHIASAYRVPIVMANVNRALSGPINIHCDHSDSMGARDTGWIQLYGEAHQEAYDNHVMAVRIAEHPEVRTPVMTMMDGFVISGALGPLQQLTDEQVQEFIGPFQAVHPLLDSDNPVTVGPFDGLHGWFFEHKASQQRAMERALRVIDEIARDYAKVSGRRYGLIDPYRMQDAEIAIVVIGSTAGSTRMIVDKLRDKGVKAGMIRVRVFRPFPSAEFAKALGGCKVVGVLDRAESFGALGGPLFLEIRAALYDCEPRPRVLPFLYGLGGRDIFPDNIEEAFEVLRRATTAKRVDVKRRYLNLRKDEV
jgi:pyruvate ferredoxin oxidoreductase alpha subunit